MNQLVVIWLLSFAFIGLKAMQQLNVVHDQKMLVVVTSFMLSACDISLVARYAATGGHTVPVIVAAGSASGIGCICAMWLHKRMRRAI